MGQQNGQAGNGQAISVEQIRRWLLAYAHRIIEQEEYLTALDADIGDADHGTNMRRGLEKVKERLEDPDCPCNSVGSLLRSVAMTLISAVGGAAGPLYGTFFLRAATSCNNSQAITPAQFAAMLRQGLEGVKQRGKAHLDDKTMVDSIQPAVEALEAAIAQHKDLRQALHEAAEAARRGMEHTAEIPARKGRASYLGPRSIGHQDPGATSAYYLFETAAQVLAKPARRRETPSRHR